jgi:hypothetical protein
VWSYDCFSEEIERKLKTFLKNEITGSGLRAIKKREDLFI